MSGRSLWAAALVLLGAIGAAGYWPMLPAPVVLLTVAWLPGRVLGERLAYRSAAGRQVLFLAGPGALSAQVAFSLALLVPIVLPFFLFAAAPSSALVGYACALTLLGLSGLTIRMDAGGSARNSCRGEWLAAAIAIATLLPVVTSYAGATIDDWWDLAFIRAYIERPTLSFVEPLLGTERAHPRFLWNSWYLMQSLVLNGRVDEAVAFQSKALAAFVCVGVVSAHALLARSVFSEQPYSRTAVIASILAIPLWLYGTEALPFFTRLHQDKFVAGLLLVPVFLALALQYLRSNEGEYGPAVFVVGVAACATHSLVFGIGLIGVASMAAAEMVAGGCALRRLSGLAGATLPLLAYPIWQAGQLRARFTAQGIALANSDNPVVLAHLSLERLLRPESHWYIVHPGAVFGSIAVVAMVAAVHCLVHRRRSDARALTALTSIPMLLIFIPGLAALVGMVIVPWMVYRIGWLVPIPLLLGMLVAAAWWPRPRPVLTALSLVVALLLVGPVAADRLQRDMREHPAAREGGPRGTTLRLYDFLADLPASSLIVADTGVARLIPSMAGRSTLAMAERATLVFSPDEVSAYGRLRDRADFFASDTTVLRRSDIVARHGLTHAVFRRRWMTAGSEDRWLRGAVGAGFALVSASADRFTPHADRDRLLTVLPPGTQIVHEDIDYFVAQFAQPTRGGDVHQTSDGRRSRSEHAKYWAQPFTPLTEEQGVQATDALVAAAVRYPGARAEFYPPPLALGATAFPVWSSGGEVWDDAPTEVRVDLTMNGACGVRLVEVRPYLPTGRREVLEVRAEGRVARRIAGHKTPIRLVLDAHRRRSVTVRVRSMMGSSFGLSDVRLYAQAGTCDEDWTPYGKPLWPQSQQSVEDGVRVIAEYPRRSTAALGLVTTLTEAGRNDDALAVLRLLQTVADPETVPLIERGLLEDAAGRFTTALRLFEDAVASDSNSAWARGCLAWAELRRKHLPAAVWHAWQAVRLDPDYSDAYTILASAAKELGLRAVAGGLLDKAVKMDRYRSWGYLESARMLDEDGDREAAIATLERFLRMVPFDEDAQALLAQYSDAGGTD